MRKLFYQAGESFAMSNLLRKRILSFFFLAWLGAGLGGCGGVSGPFDMMTDATVFVGDPSPVAPLAFLVNPIEQSVLGDLTAEIETEFPDRFALNPTSLNLTFDFAGIGVIIITLDPNNPSSATVFKLNSSNRPSGTNTMNLNLVIQTPEQNLVLSNVSLESDTALLQLAEDLPTLGFFVQGQPKELDLADLNVLIPPELITSDTSSQ
jgi:hypothetical protein